jgi:hypothetical protein
VTDEPFFSAADLISRNLVDWQEAVAIVQSICDRLLLEGGGIPELSQIGLGATGEVILLQAAAASEWPVRQLGYALVALLQGGGAPAPLRLFASQATASRSQYQSLGDFSRGLSYFGRPDRPRVLQDAYGRAAAALAAKPIAPVDQQSDAYGAESLVESDVPAESRTTTRDRRLAAGAISLLTASAVTFAVWRHPDLNPVRWPLFNRTAASTVAAVEAGISSGLDLLSNVGLASSPPAVPARSPLPAMKARKTARPAKAAAPRRSTVKAATAARNRPPAPAVAATAEAAAPPTQSATVRLEELIPARPPLDTRIYTDEDADVTPPSLFRPQLPALPRETLETAPGFNEVVVDVLITEYGAVDSVKFVTPPTDLRQRMLISAIKAWHYHPALKDGQPVRFRHRVWLTP